MTNRQLGIVGAVALVMLVITIVLYSGSGASRSDFVSGTPLIQGLDTGQIHKVVVKSGEKTVTLTGTSKGLVVEEKSNYPASVKEINGLVIKCLEIRLAAKVTDKKENHKDLGVTEGHEDATTVSFIGQGRQDSPKAAGKDEDKDISGNGGEHVLVGFVKGKSAEGSMGVYVRLLGQDTVYRTEENVWLNDKPIDYIGRNLVKLDKEGVMRVEVKTDKDSYTIARDDKDNDKVVLANIPKGKKAKTWDVGSTFEALSSLDMADVMPAGKEKLDWDATYTAYLKTHISYTVQLAKKDDKHYVRVSASFPPDLKITRPAKDEKDEEVKKKAAIWEACETAPRFTRRHKDWVYELSSYDAEKLRKPFKDLVEDDLPDEIAASHILISYKGAENADEKITRTKDEAKKLAEKVLKEAKKKDADFAKLAEKHSDGPTKTKGGDLGTFKKGKRAAEFDAAAFKLKVNGISDVVETKFGFHIIKRTK